MTLTIPDDLRRFILTSVPSVPYLEAVLRVYNRLGRRDNIHRARIKVLVKELGPAKFTELVEAEWQQIDKAAFTLNRDELARMKAHFTPHPYAAGADADRSYDTAVAADSAFASYAQALAESGLVVMAETCTLAPRAMSHVHRHE